MRTNVKEWCFVEAISLTTILLITNLGNARNAPTLIPANHQNIDSWFDQIVTPMSQRKNEIDTDIVEAENAAETITVRKDGSGKFESIVEALKTVETENKKRVIIDIGPGEYEEKITVERFKSYVTLFGNPEKPPTIVFGGTADKYGDTSESATLIVEADDFVGANLIIKNSSPPPKGETTGEQGAALRVSGDEIVFYNCIIQGSQFTLCDDMGKHLFKSCIIEGTSNFIFGEGQSIYLNSELNVVESDTEGSITANARTSDRFPSGFSFVHCKISGPGKDKTYLGRPWASASRVIYSFCEMSDVVKPEGWNLTEARPTVFFGEYKNEGTGAKADQRVKFAKQLTEKEAQEFISMEFIEAAHWLLPKPTNPSPPAPPRKASALPTRWLTFPTTY